MGVDAHSRHAKGEEMIDVLSHDLSTMSPADRLHLADVKVHAARAAWEVVEMVG